MMLVSNFLIALCRTFSSDRNYLAWVKGSLEIDPEMYLFFLLQDIHICSKTRDELVDVSLDDFLT